MPPRDSSSLDGKLQYRSVFDISGERQSSPFMSIWSAAHPVLALSTRLPDRAAQARRVLILTVHTCPITDTWCGAANIAPADSHERGIHTGYAATCMCTPNECMLRTITADMHAGSVCFHCCFARSTLSGMLYFNHKRDVLILSSINRSESINGEILRIILAASANLCYWGSIPFCLLKWTSFLYEPWNEGKSLFLSHVLNVLFVINLL